MIFTENEIITLNSIDNIRDKCLILVFKLFADKKDKNNEPYIKHLIRVSNSMKSEDGKILGLIHDIIEDTSCTYKDLIDIGVNKKIIDALKLVTNKDKKNDITLEEKLEIYNNKISNIINSNNILAIELKYNDMKDNFNKDRLNKMSQEQKDWFKKKYENNLIKLNKKLEESYDRY